MTAGHLADGSQCPQGSSQVSCSLTKTQQDSGAHRHPEELAPLGSGDIDVGHQGKQDAQADDQLVDRAQGAADLSGGDLHSSVVGVSDTRGLHVSPPAAGMCRPLSQLECWYAGTWSLVALLQGSC